MTLAGAFARLVEVEMLVEPCGLEDRPARRRVDVLDRVVVGLHEVEGDVDLIGQEGLDLAGLVVREEAERDAVEASPAFAGLGRAGPVLIAIELDRVGRGSHVLERTADDRIADLRRERVGHVALGLLELLDVVLRQRPVAADGAEPAGVRRREVEVGFEAVGGNRDLVDLVPAELLRRVDFLVVDPFPGELEVVHRQGLPVRPLQVRLELGLDGEAASRRIFGHVVLERDRPVGEVRQVVAVGGYDEEGAHRGRVDLAVGERVREVRIELVGSLPVGDDDPSTGRPGLGLVVGPVQELVVIDFGRRRCRARSRGCRRLRRSGCCARRR